MPRGVTVEYLTTDYQLDTSVKAVEVHNDYSGGTSNGAGIGEYIVPIIIGAVSVAGLGLIFFFLLKNRKKEQQ